MQLLFLTLFQGRSFDTKYRGFVQNLKSRHARFSCYLGTGAAILKDFKRVSFFHRLKSELESSNSWKDRLQESREQDARAKASLEERLSKLECDRVLAEEKLTAEMAAAKYVCAK